MTKDARFDLFRDVACLFGPGTVPEKMLRVKGLVAAAMIAEPPGTEDAAVMRVLAAAFVNMDQFADPLLRVPISKVGGDVFHLDEMPPGTGAAVARAFAEAGLAMTPVVVQPAP